MHASRMSSRAEDNIATSATRPQQPFGHLRPRRIVGAEKQDAHRINMIGCAHVELLSKVRECHRLAVQITSVIVKMMAADSSGATNDSRAPQALPRWVAR